MGVHAEPKGLHAPLKGGEDGATVSVEPILTGQILAPPAFFEKADGALWRLRALGVGVPKSSWALIPLPAFLVRHPGVGPILIDAGMHPSVATSPQDNLGRLTARLFDVRVSDEQVLARQLRERGVDPSDVRLVVMTHLHFDHASGISEFPRATFVVSDAEWKHATTERRPWLYGYRPQQFDYAFDYRTIDFSRGRVESYSTFARTFDLLGDGSIRACFTPGHSAGHLSVVLRLSGGRHFVVGGDAIYTTGQLADAPPPPRPYDEHTWRRSVQELRLFAREHPDAVITAGHDAEQWATLDERYE